MCPSMMTKTTNSDPVPVLTLTAEQVSQRLQLAPSTVYFYATVGKLPAIRIGKHWRFSAEKIQALVNGKGGRRGADSGIANNTPPRTWSARGRQSCGAVRSGTMSRIAQ